MKQLLTFIAFICMGYAANAQSNGSPALDTLDNAGTVNILQPNTTYFNNNMSGTWAVVVKATKISGTTAGYAILQTSVDGTNYFAAVGDSLALSNTSGLQGKQFYKQGVRCAKARVQFVGSGSQSTQVSASFTKGD